MKIREISYCAKNRDRVLADWTKSPKSCAKFVGTKQVENIMEWHHVTVAEDFLNEASDVWQPCNLWQYGLWSFQMGDTKLERFFA